MGCAERGWGQAALVSLVGGFWWRRSCQETPLGRGLDWISRGLFQPKAGFCMEGTRSKTVGGLSSVLFCLGVSFCFAHLKKKKPEQVKVFP